MIGVYELGRADHVLYIGSGRICDRLRSHERCEEKHFHQYRCLVTNDRRRAIQIERRELHRFEQSNERLPLYNEEVPYPP